MANTIDLSGLVRPQLVEATKREDNPEYCGVPAAAARARFRPHAGQCDAPTCSCRRCAARPCGRSASTAWCTSTRPSPALSRTSTRSSATSRRSRSTLPDEVERRVLRIAKSRPRHRHRRRHRRHRRRARHRSVTPSLHAHRRARLQRRALREQGTWIRRERRASDRPRTSRSMSCASMPSTIRSVVPTSPSRKPASASAPTTTGSRSPSKPTARCRPRSR